MISPPNHERRSRPRVKQKPPASGGGLLLLLLLHCISGNLLRITAARDGSVLIEVADQEDNVSDVHDAIASDISFRNRDRWWSTLIEVAHQEHDIPDVHYSIAGDVAAIVPRDDVNAVLHLGADGRDPVPRRGNRLDPIPLNKIQPGYNKPM